MVDFAFVGQEVPSIFFFYARLRVFLELSGGHRPQVGFFLPRDCAAFSPILITLYPLIHHSLIAHHLEMTAIEYRDTEVRSSELKTGLSSSNDSVDKYFEIVVSKPSLFSKPSSSSSSIPFHALSKSCFLEKRHLKSIRKRFQLPGGVATRLPRPNEKACTFVHGEVSFYEVAFSCGLCFPVHPFIMKLLSTLNVAPG